jgi:hypothetical protein
VFSNKYFANIGRILSSKPPAGFLRAFFGRNFTALKTANPAKGWFRIKPCCAAFRPENPSRKHLPAGRNFRVPLKKLRVFSLNSHGLFRISSYTGPLRNLENYARIRSAGGGA